MMLGDACSGCVTGPPEAVAQEMCGLPSSETARNDQGYRVPYHYPARAAEPGRLHTPIARRGQLKARWRPEHSADAAVPGLLGARQEDSADGRLPILDIPCKSGCDAPPVTITRRPADSGPRPIRCTHGNFRTSSGPLVEQLALAGRSMPNSTISIMRCTLRNWMLLWSRSFVPVSMNGST